MKIFGKNKKIVPKWLFGGGACGAMIYVGLCIVTGIPGWVMLGVGAAGAAICFYNSIQDDTESTSATARKPNEFSVDREEFNGRDHQGQRSRSPSPSHSNSDHCRNERIRSTAKQRPGLIDKIKSFIKPKPPHTLVCITDELPARRSSQNISPSSQEGSSYPGEWRRRLTNGGSTSPTNQNYTPTRVRQKSKSDGGRFSRFSQSEGDEGSPTIREARRTFSREGERREGGSPPAIMRATRTWSDPFDGRRRTGSEEYQYGESSPPQRQYRGLTASNW